MPMKSKADDNRTRAPHGQGPARGQQAKEARLAEALRANLRKRKAQAKGRDADAAAPEKGPKGK
jgi:hypothetical protein